MGNTTDPFRPEARLHTMGAVEAMARAGDALAAQRVELYAIADQANARLVAAWSPLGGPEQSRPDGTVIPLSGFPWSLGNIKATEYMFIRNAASLPACTDDGTTLGQMGLCSALHLPLVRGKWLAGALCAYWANERAAWPAESRDRVCDWAIDALSARR